MTGERDKGITTRGATALVLVAAAALVAAALLAFPRIEGAFVARAQEDGKSTLRLVSDAVDQAVGRYGPLPGLIAGDPTFRDLLRDTAREGSVPFVNEKLRLTAISVAASEIYVMDPTGLTVASSNYREPASFMGQNFAFRPYFQRAIGGGTTQFHALGTTSGERGFFFAAPILDGIEVAGVLAVKVTADAFETAWEGSAREIIVADPNGVAFLSSRPDYRMRTLAPLSADTRTMIAETRQFPLDQVTPIPFSASVITPGAVEVTLGAGSEGTRYLADSLPLQLVGWHAIVLTPLDPVRAEAVYALVVWTLAVTALALLLLILIQSRARVLERIRAEQSQRDLLERRVRERTADLDAANASLRTEIIERKSAEERLRKTQKNLIQAGKLAALGQMSAALSHEINQPLAAVKSYADNAAQFLERKRLEDVGANIARISEMADRMARISAHLRNFARRPGDRLKAVPVGEVIREAIALTEPQVRKSGAEIVFEPPDEEVWAIGGRLRLQQVIVNILTNAIDAMHESQRRIVKVAVMPGADAVAIEVRDHGPGLPPDTIDQVFEAFFTTKEVGAGMGLGLSISYNIVEDFGGGLTAANHPDGGAVFTVRLRPAAAAGTMVAE